jgi:hypothetical protein
LIETGSFACFSLRKNPVSIGASLDVVSGRHVTALQIETLSQ